MSRNCILGNCVTCLGLRSQILVKMHPRHCEVRHNKLVGTMQPSQMVLIFENKKKSRAPQCVPFLLKRKAILTSLCEVTISLSYFLFRFCLLTFRHLQLFISIYNCVSVQLDRGGFYSLKLMQITPDLPNQFSSLATEIQGSRGESVPTT